jgi:hypothetical protein
VSGEDVLLAGGGRIAEYVRTLARLPSDPPWVLVGGLAVNVRLARVHRATSDVDTVSPDQPGLVEIMVAGGAEPLSAGKVQFRDPDVEVDVMPSTEGEELPRGPDDRCFALVRRWAMRTATAVSLGVFDDAGEVIERTELQVASTAALVALKAVAIPRRRDGNYPEKIGSDIQDLFRLVDGSDLEGIVSDFDELDAEARDRLAHHAQEELLSRS